MKKRWLLVFVAAIMLLVFPVVSLAGGNEVQLEGETGPVESASESPSTEPTPAPTPEPTPVPTPGPTPTPLSTPTPAYKLSVHSVSLYVWDEVTIKIIPTPPADANCWLNFDSPHNMLDINLNTGNVTAVSEGTAKVNLMIEGRVVDTCVITVLPTQLTGVKIISSMKMNLGEEINIVANLLPENKPRGVTVSFSNSNNSVVSLGDAGTGIKNAVHVTAVGVGTTKLTVKAGGFTDTCTITVVDPNAAPTPTVSPVAIPSSSISATPRPSSSAAAVTSTPGPTRGAGESGGPQPTRIPVQLDATGWEAAEEAISGMEPGSLGSIPTPEDTLVPVTLLQTLKQTQCALQIDMGDYTCTIDGVDLAEMPVCMEPIDIGMTMEKDAKLSAACGGNAYELRFNYHGELPGVFTFRVKAEGSHPGDTIYVYFYDEEAGVFESHVTATVDDEGYVSFGITHCSSYCITSKMIPGALNNFELPAEAAEKPEAERASGFAAFVEDNYIAFWVCVYALGCAAVVTVFVVIFHRRGRKKAAGQQTVMKQ